ncbi:L-histidine N(alpha)-methyltransferase [Paraburkholderia dipogonis]|uniref:L-histidine N(alpha)-methyltransferase n=1 Tax=Paraburkholderia dipogonis TaxID=1211383 RepID=UPI0038B83296
MSETSEIRALQNAGRELIQAIRQSDYGRDLLAGLSRSPRSISPKYFYDAAGSALFDRICELPEYYPTRTELDILRTNASEIVEQLGAHANIIEFGAGSLEKIRVLLDAFRPDRAPDRFIPVDISAGHLEDSAQSLRRAYPCLEVLPIAGDYMKPEQLADIEDMSGRKVGFFPGSTIGNFTPHEAAAFLRRARTMLAGGGLLVGVDLIKDAQILHQAYNDSEGVTAAFNLNLLARANAELQADFDLGGFMHKAFYNEQMQRIEMHLVSLRRQTVRVAGYDFRFDEGETIHTENSHKFTVEGFREIAAAAGFTPGPVWTDDAGLFSVHWLESPGAMPSPQ